jgi:hypothetical protein
MSLTIQERSAKVIDRGRELGWTVNDSRLLHSGPIFTRVRLGLTIGIFVLSWILYQVTMESIQTIIEYYQLIEEL